MLAFAIQQNESATCVHRSPLFWVPFPRRSRRSTERTAPCCTAGSHCSPLCMCVCPSFPVHACFPLGISTFVLYICFCFANKFICTIFLNSTHGQYYIFVFKVREKEMATHSSILAWRIPWTEELGGLQSMGCKESDTTERLHFHSLHFSRLSM